MAAHFPGNKTDSFDNAVFVRIKSSQDDNVGLFLGTSQAPDAMKDQKIVPCPKP